MKLITMFLTCANKDEAQKIADELLNQKLVACVRQMEVKSDFWWQGKKEHAEEVQLIIESSEDKYEAIERTIRQLHSYKTFALMAYPVLKAPQAVERWIKESIT